jgi:hypothetical protein
MIAIEADFQGTGRTYVKPVAPAPVSLDKGQKARETLDKLESGELGKPPIRRRAPL